MGASQRRSRLPYPVDLAITEKYYLRNWTALKNKKGGTNADASYLLAFRDLWDVYKRYSMISTCEEVRDGDYSSREFLRAIDALIYSYTSIGRNEIFVSFHGR